MRQGKNESSPRLGSKEAPQRGPWGDPHPLVQAAVVVQMPRVGGFQPYFPPPAGECVPGVGDTDHSRLMDSQDSVRTEVGALLHSHWSLRKMRVPATVEGGASQRVLEGALGPLRGWSD